MMLSHQHPVSALGHLSSASFSSSVFHNDLHHSASTSLQGLSDPCSSWAVGSALRCGAAASAALDMAKETQHLGVLSSYGVVTVLILNCALRLYTSTKFKRDPTNKYDWLLPNLFSLSSGICVITGAFTGVMFQLLGIYSKSALGMGNIAGYVAFKEATADFLQFGFRTFLACLGSFVATFLLSFRNRTNEDERPGHKVFSLVVVLALCGSVVLKKVLDLATVHIFAPMM